MTSDLETLQKENAAQRSELQATRTQLQTTQRKLKKALHTIKQLGMDIEALKRKQARQAAPFSKNTPNFRQRQKYYNVSTSTRRLQVRITTQF
jgi:FtsZ-binding cell division protein ZapB